MSKIDTDSMSLDEKRWFAYAIAGMICADGRLDASEQIYLKHAIAFLKNKEEIDILIKKVKTREISELWPLRIAPEQAIEMLKHLASLTITDGQLSEIEIDYFQHVGNMLGVPANKVTKILKAASQLVQKKSQKTESEPATETPTEQNLMYAKLSERTTNRSVAGNFVKCYICGQSDITFWTLRPNCMVTKPNVLGVTTYPEAMPGQEYCNFNLIQVVVCPQCSFASRQVKCFQSNAEEQCPFNAEEARKIWMETLPQRQEKLKNEHKSFFTIERLLSQAIKAYDCAIETHDCLAGIEAGHDHTFEVVCLLMIQAELIMNQKRQKDAENILRQVISRLEPIHFHLTGEAQQQTEDFLSLIGLYFKEKEDYGGAFQYNGFHIASSPSSD